MSAARRKPKHVSKEDLQAVDSPPLTRAQIDKMKPAVTELPDVAASYRRSRGRPKAEQRKTLVSLRIDAEIIAAFKSEGPGWQTRLNAVLARWAKRRKKAA
jgi:uncharacterized protein (DUF4415 family)